ncbi:acetyl-CoA carboxylase biotin carboxyl carrier protein [Blattabacterium sp. (Blaberus giganteus)]|uniref:acetyl-CoA carboxylase biotin carboxyl carrier protein n=1 Tax=Blattabacterium sp. (Blaberus giganteus) TaxID=1186051 RepID=UPI00025F6E70|nr:acetyl-CoA carboxylase biotin carboxyl carrier protein [Blattabacterium sp. (Blaberus giganteus)]AFJ90574.1 biotin carboxyl carrier protein of acetyl-CoA carboxylase [Blattabacterium sp. (Blaberus giganteus)]
MDLKKIKSLIQFISDSNIDEIRIKMENMEIYMKNRTLIKNQKDPCNSPTINSKKISSSSSSSSTYDFHDIFYKKEKENKNQYLTIKSPMIGTFYRKPHPDQDPFVKIGDKIKIGTKVCVIEAMKLFNDIESEINGTLIKVLVEDASPVDYDQPLFLIDPNC